MVINGKAVPDKVCFTGKGRESTFLNVTVNGRPGESVTIIEPGLTERNAHIFDGLSSGELSLNQAFLMAAPWLYDEETTGSEYKRKKRAVLEYWGHRCANCEKPVSFSSCHLDHHLPRSKGYLLVDGNMVILCPRCNTEAVGRGPAAGTRTHEPMVGPDFYPQK